MARCLSTLALAVAFLLTTTLQADEPWNRFRGPNGSGISAATTVPITWTESDYNWQVDLPGTGASSPVVWGDKLFVTAANVDTLERKLLCYSTADGKLLWSHAYPFAKEKKHARNTYATNTPAVDAERVYSLWQTSQASQLVAHDHAGKELWKLELGPYSSHHGGGLSPIVVDGLVAINNAHEGDSFLLGVDGKTGKEVWRVPRKKVKASYSTPCALTAADGSHQLIFTSWKQGITCVEPASGKVLWEQNVFEPDGVEKRAIGSPVTSSGVVYATCGFTAGKKLLVALDPSTAGEDGGKKELFRSDRGTTHMPSTLVYNSRVFNWTDSGIVFCLDAQSGKSLWQGRLGGNYSGSPVCVNGKLYSLSEEGEMVVIAAADELVELAKIKLDTGSSSTPAVSDGVMYFRTDGKLYSIGGPNSPALKRTAAN